MAPVFDSNLPDSKKTDSNQSNLQKALTPVISTQDRGFLYGDGVFETVRYRNGKLLLWELHRSRLLRSCEMLAIPLHIDEFDALIFESLAYAPAHDCILKIIVTRGDGGRGYAPPKMPRASIILQWHTLPQGIQESARQGIDCIYCDHPLSGNPVTAGIKHLNRLDQVMASIQLSQAADRFPAVREGLMCDADGNVVEGTRSNIFVMINGTLCTPDLSNAGVMGVMRSYLIEQIREAGISVEIRPVRKQELSLASELFVCNSVFGVWPVARILDIKNNTADVEFAFLSRHVADIARNAVQEIFPL